MHSRTIRVLILDDDPDDALLLEDHFHDLPQDNYATELVSGWIDARDRLKASDFDILLCDYRLGAISGIEVIENLRAEGMMLPVVLLTGVGTRELDERALTAGASDFLAKDELTPALIDRTIRYAMAAHERQRLLQTVLDSTGAAVMLLDENDNVVLSNTVAKEFGEKLTRRRGESAFPLNDLARFAVASQTDEIRLADKVLDRSTTAFGADQQVVVLHDVTDRAKILEERSRSERRMAHAARHDALTGLGNRLAFSETIENWIGAARRHQSRFALLSFDLNRFKEVNDVYGHSAGDELLHAVAKRLQDVAGSELFLARLGGDEFIALVPMHGTGLNEAASIAETMLNALLPPYELAGKVLRVNASVGIAVYPEHGVDSDTLVANADLAMYRAKTTPLESFCFFNEQMDAAVRSDRAMVDELRDAMEADALDIFVQPQTTLSDRVLTGFETLARWSLSNGNEVPPDRFIKVAERSGLILPLGEHLMERSLQAAAGWNNEAKVAINVSPVQVNHCDLPALLRQAMVRYNVSPKQVEIEITETALLEHSDRALHALRQVRAMGVSVALDDFGTGYSSLAMLQSFPFDKVKIDRSFVMDLDRHGNTAIVRSIAQLGENLGIRVLCEGVETESHAQLLDELGVDEMQGYLLAKPFRADLADDWSAGFAANGYADVA